MFEEKVNYGLFDGGSFESEKIYYYKFVNVKDKPLSIEIMAKKDKTSKGSKVMTLPPAEMLFKRLSKFNEVEHISKDMFSRLGKVGESGDFNKDFADQIKNLLG